MLDYLKIAWKEAKKLKEIDKKKSRLLKKNMDYAFLEEVIQKMNENPLLRVQITLKDGTTLECTTTPKKTSDITYSTPTEEEWKVK